jgi:ferredoxin-NADP reductase
MNGSASKGTLFPTLSAWACAEHEGKQRRVTLLCASRQTVAAYKDDFDAMAQRNPNLKVHYFFHPQRLDETSIKERVADLKKPLFYISGPEMVESLGKIVKQIGVPEEHIKQDWFPGYPED